MIHRWLLVTSLVFLIPACGKKDKEGGGTETPAASGASAGGCDRRANEKLCGEYRGRATADWVKKECEAMKVPYVAACPKDGAVGRCLGEGGTETVYYAPMTKETVQAMCQPPMKLGEI